MRFVALVLVAAACDGSPPELHVFEPANGTELRGVEFAAVHIEYSDQSETDVTLLVDGVEIAHPIGTCSDEVCDVDATWDTSALSIGDHQLAVELRDIHGHITESVHTIWIDDVLTITSLQVQNIVDESGTLEIEVYAFDDATNEMIGCAGTKQGMGSVDQYGIDYPLDAIVIRTDSVLFATKDVADRLLRLEVWEDDDDPVCPVFPDPVGNDLVGVSPPRTVEDWRRGGRTAFGNVVALGVAWTRTLAE